MVIIKNWNVCKVIEQLEHRESDPEKISYAVDGEQKAKKCKPKTSRFGVFKTFKIDPVKVEVE